MSLIRGVRTGWIPIALAKEFRTNVKTVLRHRNVGVYLELDGVQGWGEAYTLEPKEAMEALEGLDLLGREAWEMEPLLEGIPHLAARAAVDMALHDALARALHLPVHHLLGLPPGRRETSVSLSVGPESEVLDAARTWTRRGFRCLKVKVTADTDPRMLLHLREEVGPEVRLRVDANQAWTVEQALEFLPYLEGAGVEFCEQPFPVGEARHCERLAEQSPVPIYLDEEITGPEDVQRVAAIPGVKGINVKVAKCGGLRRSLQTIQTARRLGLRVMVGCYFESSLAVAAAWHLTALADAVDLDAPLFLAEDPFDGLSYADGGLQVEGPGIGVAPRTPPF
jgi:L-alanine-DL-glutamate epimerase-like enolase superfamily enzyme